MLYANEPSALVASLAGGEIHYRTYGPADSEAPPVVFVHGFLVDATLWTDVAVDLAWRGVRSFVPTWPLGSHRTPMHPDADLSPRGVARIVIDFLAALDLDGVTLVGNDTGGAICQLVLDTDASRVGRVVLTNCDAFEAFPPKAFSGLFSAGRHPALVAAIAQPMRLRWLRHSPLSYGMLLRRPRDAARTKGWVEPVVSDPAIRADVARFCRGMVPGELVEVGGRLNRFDGPTTVLWGRRDRFFTPQLGHRLADAFAAATFVEADTSTFVAVDAPDAVADAIEAIAERPTRTGAVSASAAPPT